jgi:hypothetical protein
VVDWEVLGLDADDAFAGESLVDGGEAGDLTWSRDPRL